PSFVSVIVRVSVACCGTLTLTLCGSAVSCAHAEAPPSTRLRRHAAASRIGRRFIGKRGHHARNGNIRAEHRRILSSWVRLNTVGSTSPRPGAPPLPSLPLLHR